MGFDISGKTLKHDSSLEGDNLFDDNVLKSILLLLVIDITGFIFFLVAFYVKKTKWIKKSGHSAPLAWLNKQLTT